MISVQIDLDVEEIVLERAFDSLVVQNMVHSLA